MLVIDNISKKYKNGYWGIRNFSMKINKGEIVCIVGPNGSGKTTVINSILNIIQPTEGMAYCDGLPSTSIEYKKDVAYIPDELLLIDALTGEEYINFVKNIYEKIDEDRLRKLINLFNMNKFIYQPIKTYSHGMKKKFKLLQPLCLIVRLLF